MSEDQDKTIEEIDELFGKIKDNQKIEPYDILIVDDVHANVYLIESMLLDDYKTRSVGGAQEMWRLIELQPPRLILLDLMMPFENGFQVLEKMKLHEKLRSIPVIVVTAKDSKEDVIKVLELGAKDFIVKPVTEEVLMAKIKKVLGE